MILLLLSLAAAADPGVRATRPGVRAYELARRLVEEVGPRPAGSPAATEAQVWVAQELQARGWVPVTVRPDRWSTVLSCKEGRQREIVLFLAHTDTVHPRVAGANDNAAAVGVLLAAAERIEGPEARTVCLAFPDAEEIGLRGSLELAERGGIGPLDQVMSLDLVGRGRLTHHGLGPAWGTERLRALLAVAPAEVPWVYRGISEAWPMMERSDHLPFALPGIPSSHLMARSEAGVDWAYHTARDLPGRLEVDTLEAAVEAVVGVARAAPLPDDDGDPAFVVPGSDLVVDGRLTWAFLVVCPMFALAGARGRPVAREAAIGVASFLGRSLAAAAAAGAALTLVAAGRPWEMALADPAIVAGWSAWALVVLSWWDLPPMPARAVGAAAAAALALLLGSAPLLALPLAVAAAGVGLSGGGLGRLPALLTAVPALYLLRPDAVRELAFHHLVPATVPVWTVAWALLTAPLLGTVWRFAPRPRRVLAGVALAMLVAACITGWTRPIEREPWVRGEQLWPGAP